MYSEMEQLDSPFAYMRSADVESIRASSGFQILRNYLADALPTEFCDEHAYDSANIQLSWLLQRDILHAMIIPLVELYQASSALASAALCSQIPEELEVAFKGEARFAYLWLQCFVSEEEDWSHTRGCPACITLQTLSTELTIRATITAALLSSKDVSPPDTPSSETGSDCDSETQPSLPDFAIVLGALGQAVSVDPFWGDGHFSELLARSQRLVAGIQELMSQCQVLEALVTSAPPSPASPCGLGLRRGHTIDMIAPGDKTKEMKLKKGKVAKRQARLKDEQESLIMRTMLQTWSAVHLPKQQRQEIRATVKKEDYIRRKRTLTT